MLLIFMLGTTISESVTVPQNSLECVLVYDRYWNVDYIVLNEWHKSSYPEIAFLLEGGGKHSS